METYFKKRPCKQCPFRRDVKPFLRAKRGEELAYHALNPYSTFPCHKTTVSSDDEEESGERICTDKTKECAGFLTLQINEGKNIPKGFVPSDLVYEDVYEMIDAYAESDS